MVRGIKNAQGLAEILDRECSYIYYDMEYSDKYTKAWDKIREFSGNDRDSMEDFVDVINYRLDH